MAEHFEEEIFEFTPPEFDISLLGGNPNEETGFTAPSVENTLEENVSADAPLLKEEVNEIPSTEVVSEKKETEVSSLENVDVAPVAEDVKEENVDIAPVVEEIKEENVDVAPVAEEIKEENVDVAPVAEEIKEENVSEDVPQFESPEMVEFEMPSDFTVPDTEEIKETPAEEIEETSTVETKETSTEKIEETPIAEVKETPAEEMVNENPSFEMPTEMANEENIPTNIEAQEKVANAIREKISEIQDAKTENNSPDITESKEEASTFEAVIDEKIQISPSSETYQTEPVSKEDMFVDGRKKLKNMIANESQQSINAIKDDILTK